jgi:hypothetical protein
MTSKPVPIATTPRTSSRLGFEWGVVVLSLWMVGGVHLDAWAHHRFDETLETFFTPWHGVLYSGFLALALLIVSRVLLNRRKVASWQAAIPKGYALSLLGIVLFLAGGVGDMLWHLIFGIEVHVEALLSPTHLLLAFGAGLMVTGPVRSNLTGEGSPWSAVVALALLLSVLTFFTSYASSLSDAQLASGLRPSDETLAFIAEGRGVSAILLQTLLWLGVTLFALRQWRLPFGALSVLFGLSSLLTVSVHQDWVLLPAVLVTGFIADLLYARWGFTRIFAFMLPMLFYALYFLTLALTEGVWWRVPLWAGSIVMAGAVGWLLSYLTLAPKVEMR